jgi:hypothetical protein
VALPAACGVPVALPVAGEEDDRHRRYASCPWILGSRIRCVLLQARRAVSGGRWPSCWPVRARQSSRAGAASRARAWGRPFTSPAISPSRMRPRSSSAAPGSSARSGAS